MDTSLTNEEVERLRRDFPMNFKEHLARVRRLLSKAQPGNWAWRTLENEYGFSGDYTEADAGEWPDAENI